MGQLAESTVNEIAADGQTYSTSSRRPGDPPQVSGVQQTLLG
jgi:hypothetical protein